MVSVLPKKTLVYKRIIRLRDGREDLQVGPRKGKPLMSINNELVVKVVKEDRQLLLIR